MAALANAKWEAVAQALVADRERIGWRAYQAVYPASSQRGAETGFSRLLKKAVFAARVAELDEKAADDGAVLSAREVLVGLSRLAAANMQDFMAIGADGQPRLDWSRLTRDQAAALQEVTVEEFVDGGGENAERVRRVKFRLADKRAALVDLGKHHKLFVERRQLEDPDGRAAGVAAAEKMSEYERARRIMFALELGARAGAGRDEQAATASERPAVAPGAAREPNDPEPAERRIPDAAPQRSAGGRRNRPARRGAARRKRK